MRRLPLLALLVAVPLAAGAVSNPGEMLPNRGQEQRAETIGHQLRCLVCQNESVEESEADLARDLRRIIRERVVAGDSDRQVVDWMVARYGDFVRLTPPLDWTTSLLWFAPVLALAIAAIAVVLTRRRAAAVSPPLSADERQKLAELLKS